MDGREKIRSFHILAICPFGHRRGETLTVTCLPLESFFLAITSPTSGTGPNRACHSALGQDCIGHHGGG